MSNIVEGSGTAVKEQNPSDALYIQNAMVKALKIAMGKGVTDPIMLRETQRWAAHEARNELRAGANRS